MNFEDDSRKQRQTPNLHESLSRALNDTGDVFQEKCVSELEAARKSTKWYVEDTEHPVRNLETLTKVDIVMRDKSVPTVELLAVVECKRAAPEYVSWIFRAMPGLPLELASPVVTVATMKDRVFMLSETDKLRFGIDCYPVQWGVEAKSAGDKQLRANPRLGNRQSIEDACVQVLHGVRGLAEEHLRQESKVHDMAKVTIVPIVITTANLFVADYETKNVDLRTGTVPSDQVLFGPKGGSPEPVDWVMLDYRGSHDVIPDAIPLTYHGTNFGELGRYRQRSIFVVNSQSMISFMSQLHFTD